MDIKKFNHIHFTGIKGVGMTALALCCQDLGIKVAGSDMEEVFVTGSTLARRGIKWEIGFSKENLEPKPDLVITTGAHGGLNNPEVVAARKMGIPVITHAEALATITDGKEVIAACGVGGKSTTAAMIAAIFDRAGLHPSYEVGVGDIPCLGAPGRYDKSGRVFIVEADEYAISPGIDNRPRFSLLTPRVVVVTNIEYDHPDIYKTIEDTKKVFREFFEKLPKNGLLVANIDNMNVREAVENFDGQVLTYGLRGGLRGRTSLTPDFSISVPSYELGRTSFNVFMYGRRWGDFEIQIPGKFNVANAMAVVAVANFYGISEDLIKKGLKEFSGTRRRFEKMGEKDGVLFYDDYAHTPNEIQATLSAAREWFRDRRVVAIFQPHTYSRTKALFDGFSKSFSDVDIVGIMDIYASAREKDDLGVSGELLANEIAKYHKNVSYVGDHDKTIKWIKENTKSGDVVLTMGAGDIFRLYEMLKIPNSK